MPFTTSILGLDTRVGALRGTNPLSSRSWVALPVFVGPTAILGVLVERSVRFPGPDAPSGNGSTRAARRVQSFTTESSGEFIVIAIRGLARCLPMGDRGIVDLSDSTSELSVVVPL